MEKMFYTLEEAATKLGKTADEVREMASRGQLQEFRDRDKLMFKREQVDLLSGGGDDDVIPLAGDSGLEPLSLSSSATGMSVESPKDSTGIALVDDVADSTDPSEMTRITSSPRSLQDPGGSKGASGSGGLLDLTKEADDTSLGAGLLEDVYGGETVASQTAVAAGGAGEASPLFETPGDTSMGTEAAAAGAALMVAAEPYNGPWSGIVGGLAVGMIAATLVGIGVLILAFVSTPGAGLLGTVGDNLFAVVGAVAAVALVGAGIGFAILRKS